MRMRVLLDIDAGVMDVDVQGEFTVDATGISLDSDAASNFTTSSGALTLAGAGGVTVTSTGGAMSLNRSWTNSHSCIRST